MNFVQFLCVGGCGNQGEKFAARYLIALGKGLFYVGVPIMLALIVANIIDINRQKKKDKIDKKYIEKCKKKIIIYSVIAVLLFAVFLFVNFFVKVPVYDEFAHCWCS